MSEPDVDITFDNSVNAAPYDGNIYLTFVTKLGYSIMAADVQMRDLVNGGTLDIMTNNNDIAEVPNQYFGIASHPSISVNDGFQAANGNYIPHAAVAYQLEFNNGTSPSTQSIYLFGVTPRTYTLTSTLVNTPATPGVTNQHPTVVTRPTDVASVTAWDYYGPALHPWNDNEGLAHTATYDLATNTFDPGYSGDMQVQTAKFPNNGTGFGNTKLTTASGFSGAQLLYFYYYHDLVNSALTIEYKTRNYFNTFLRSSINEAVNGLTIYPNPVSSIININSNDILTAAELTDVTGRVFTTLKGDKKELEAGLNKNISTLPTGVYFLKFTKEDGQSVVTKFLKQ